MFKNIHNLVVLVGEMDEEGVDRIAESASDVIEEATSDNYFHLLMCNVIFKGNKKNFNISINKKRKVNCNTLIIND